MRHFVVLLISAASWHAASAANAFYDCNRNGINCGDASNTCSTTGNGVCTCGTGYALVNNFNPCAKLATNSACTTKTCMNGGTCKLLSDGTTQKCFCADFYYGDTCDTPRVTVDCSNITQMKITVRPYPDSAVKIYPINNATDTVCHFSFGAVAGVYVKTYDLSSPASLSCGLTQTANSTTDGVTNTVTLVVQHTVMPDILMASDLKFDAKCLVGSAFTPIEQSFNFSTASIDSTLQKLPDGTVPTSEVTPVKMELQQIGGLLRTPVVMGSLIDVILYMKTDGVYKDMLVHSCYMNNGETAGSTNFDQFQFVDGNGCLIHVKGIVEFEQVKSSTVANGVTTILTEMLVKAFKFTKGTGNLIKVGCFAKLCYQACAQPNATTCASSQGLVRYGRKRRSAEDGRELVTSFRVSLQGVDNQGSTGNGSSSTGSSGPSTAAASKDCLEDSRTLAIIIVLAVFVVLLFLAVIIVAACAAQRIRRRKGSYCDGSSSQNLSIPRPDYKH